MTNEELNKWLADEIMVYSGCCSSIECVKYDIAKETAIKMAAWKEQQMIEKAVEWLKIHMLYGKVSEDYKNEIINKLKKAMEE